jgi:hypothetical protein
MSSDDAIFGWLSEEGMTISTDRSEKPQKPIKPTWWATGRFFEPFSPISIKAVNQSW